MLVAAAFLLWLLLYRLDAAPHTWFDEGAHLHVAKNLALNGVYADFSSDGNRYTGPVRGVGPTVILPVAAMFRLFGVSFFVARFVIAAYALGALIALWALCRNLVDARYAWLAVAVSIPFAEFTYYSRTVFGEVPALFYLFAALWVWWRPGAATYARLLGCGLLFGLACITKTQSALIILPSLLVAWIVDLMVYRRHPWRYFVIPGALAGAVYFSWMVFMLFLLGHDERDVWADFELFRNTSSLAIMNWSLDNLRSVWWSYPIYGRLCLVAFPFWLFCRGIRGAAGQQWLLLLLLLGFGGVLLLGAFEPERYAFSAIALAAPFVAYLLYEATRGFPCGTRDIAVLTRWRPTLSRVGSAAVAVFLLVALTLHANEVRAWRGHEEAYDMARFLNERLPADTVIETFEQEFAVLTDHRFHYPPQQINVQVTNAWRARGRVNGQSYDQIGYGVTADYALVRRAPSVSADFYSTERLSGFALLYEVGDAVAGYDLYAREGVSPENE